MRRCLRIVVAACAALAAAAPAAAQPSITVFAGYGSTHGIDNATTGVNADVDAAATFGVAFGIPLDAGRDLELRYRQQSTSLAPGGAAAPFDLTVRTLHIGGTLDLGQVVGAGFHAVGGVGVTQFSPSTGGYGSEVKPSFDLGVGYLLPLGRHLALRAEARGYLVLVNSSGGFLCSGGCIAVLKSDAVTQFEASIGLMARF